MARTLRTPCRVDRVAELLGKTVEATYQDVARRRIPFRRLGRNLVFFEEEILQFLDDQKLVWREQTAASPAERLVEFAGRICYLSFGDRQHRKTNKDYIENLIAADHGSVLEHSNWSFILSGVSRAFTHQLVRHRVGFSFSQLSQQYHDETEAEFVEPAGLEVSPAALAAWIRFRLAQWR